MKALKLSLIWLLLVCSHLATAQIKHIGLPLINNFPRTIYKASTQNWSIAQNKHGFVYFGNNDGLLEFDGQHWTLYRMPNNSIVRSVLVVGDTIFAGAYEELGYFAPGKDGGLAYTSLLSLVPDEYRSFDEVWKIFKTSKGIVFQSFRLLMLFDGQQMHFIQPKSIFGHAYQDGDDIYIPDNAMGLFRLRHNKLELVSADERFRRVELRCLIPMADGKHLVGFISGGLFMMQNGVLSPWETKVNDELKQNIVFSGIRLSNGLLAFGTIQNGLYISDTKGQVLQHLNRFKGLLNNTVLSLAEDREGNLWLGLDNGIDYVEISSPLSIFDHTYHIESTYASVVHQGMLFVGTNQGLYYALLSDLDNRRRLSTSFSLMQGTEGQVWSLSVIDGKLLCGHNFGLFEIKGTEAVKLAGDRGYWEVMPWDNNADTLICGTYNGLTVMIRQGNSWAFAWKVKDYSESSRSMVHFGNTLWIAHGYRGLFKLELDKQLQRALTVRLYSKDKGLPPDLPYGVFADEGEPVFISSAGLLRYDQTADVFVPHERLSRIFGNQRVNYIKPDRSGNYWYFYQGRLGLLRLMEDGKYNNITAPFNRISDMIILSYENIYVYDNQNVFIGTKNGLMHYDPTFRRAQPLPHPVFLREFSFGKAGERLSFFNLNVQKANELFEQGQLKLPYRQNDIALRFASPVFEASNNVEFSFRLKGFDRDWSPWTKITLKEYTNLPEGQYLFEIKSRVPGGISEEIFSFPFAIKPPFYRTTTAYLIYVAVLILVVIGNVVVIQRRISRSVNEAREKHEEELQKQKQQFREQALLAEKEIVNLRNVALQNEVEHKNKELANTTLHLIHKNKILNAIKASLVQINNTSLNATARDEIETLVARINRELKNERFQKLFDETFDRVHDDFLVRLKARHPELTPRELRLCALLRMNLSTKEIAPLMNISVRGVEIGRYRLRKKLNLDRDENLIDYLIKF